ncbi:sigma-70 family RNA polymerase sigma factor [Mucilaginibacter sp. JRF]|uniref:RNA polymerase sigma factor n=1 Tax=Mucilaginibacter sp. JRF TaxID=2780088 RepID=UPI001880A5B7|nr:sigma-70 family RNA polymerase sigma factor [Mucilaginibacter sp. JRF]MBE9585252.1 sigma-70 family RNA polymerase sigma factor [Mucilaginibacter sp. JRF]
MNTRLQNLADTPLQAKVQDVQFIYDRYAGMLLGYIYDVVKDRTLAEQYLNDTFTTVALLADELTKSEENIYRKLQLIARGKLSSYFNTMQQCDISETVKHRPNKYLNSMSERQLQVFCGVHYHGKKINTIAAEMNEPEDVVKKLLKEAFLIIRKSNDARVY